MPDLNERQLELLGHLRQEHLASKLVSRRQWSMSCMLTYLSAWLNASLKPMWVFGEPEARQTSPLGLQRVSLSVFWVSLPCTSSPLTEDFSQRPSGGGRDSAQELLSPHTCSHAYTYATLHTHTYTHYLAKTYPVKACSHSPPHTQQIQRTCLDGMCVSKGILISIS